MTSEATRAAGRPNRLLLAAVLDELELSPADWSHRRVWAFAFLFYFVGLVLARRRYQ